MSEKMVNINVMASIFGILQLLALNAEAQPVTCRFKPATGAVQHQSTCIAEHLTDKFYRRIASCRGINGCVLNVGSLRPIRLWSPDSRNEVKLDSALPSTDTFTFQLFPRAAMATKGPWISAATQKSVVVRWETRKNASSWLRVVELSPPHGARWIKGSSSCSTGAMPPCVHTAIVTDLNSGGRYDFVLGDVVPDTATGQHPGGRFVTEPVVGADTEYSFSVVGDVQGQGGKAWKDVAGYTGSLQSYTGRPGGPVLHTGDMTASSTNWNDFFSLGDSMLSSHPFYPALGNNDNKDSFLRYFGPTGRVNPTGYDLDWKPYYSVNYGNTHFIVLDTSDTIPPTFSCTDDQGMWLKDDLKGQDATTAENIVVVTHWGPRGYGVYGDNPDLKLCLESLFRDSNGKPTDFFRKLRMVFSGHQHYYERISAAHTVGSDTRKVHYVTVGTAGALQGADRCPESGLGLEASSASVCSNPDDPSSDGTYDYQGVVVDVRGRVFELRAYNFAYDSVGNRVPKGSSGTWYSILDCFAMDDKGKSVPPQNSCNP